jgi:adenine-specific DNA-methyltransferase
MSTNLSKQKRQNLTSKIKAIHKYIASAKQDENTRNLLTYLSELEKEINAKKFGLVFEEHREAIDETLETHTPVLTENKKLFIDNGGQMNFLIEGDNLAALQLLLKTHKGKIDVIYIDPPYNTGAKDWKYDNDYVDKNDTFRHSKWLSMMEKRIILAKKLLSSRGVFICAIDENELHTIGLLLESVFGKAYEIHCIVVIHNPNGTQGKNFSYAHEYAIFVLPRGDKIIGLQNRTDSPDIRPLRDVSKGDNMRTDAKNCFYPILVKDNQIIGFGDVCDNSFHPSGMNVLRNDGVLEIYPIDASGNERKWVFARQTVESIKNELRVEWNKSRKAFDIIRRKTMFTYKTFWDRKELNANIFGTKLLKNIIPDCPFDFPKSLYNVKDCIGAILTKNNNGIYLDFFAGSGTTGHAVLELNKQDGGHRKFILCTNNENKICEEITYERIKTVITGKRKDKSSYSDGIIGSLKYYKIDYIPISDRLYYEYADELLLYIRELVELENGINFLGNDKIAIVLTDEELDDFIKNIKKHKNCRKLYRAYNLLLTKEQKTILDEMGIKSKVIPNYYYKPAEE